MKAIATAFRALVLVLLTVVTIIFGYLAWEATKHHLVLGDLLAQYVGDLGPEVAYEVAWLIIAALFAPWLGFALWLTMLCHIGDNPSSPAGKRERAAALLREADVVERLQAQRRQDLLQVSRVNLEARRPLELPRR